MYSIVDFLAIARHHGGDLSHITHPMTESLGHRIFLAHLELSYRLGRKVTLAELGALTAVQMGRPTPFTAASVSRWESGAQAPTPAIIEAIGRVTGTDPGWISHGSRSAAPPPGGQALNGSAGHLSLMDGSPEPQRISIRLGSAPKS
jgi:transcriptional regulator with XRE-family HTH domain